MDKAEKEHMHARTGDAFWSEVEDDGFIALVGSILHHAEIQGRFRFLKQVVTFLIQIERSRLHGNWGG